VEDGALSVTFRERWSGIVKTESEIVMIRGEVGEMTTVATGNIKFMLGRAYYFSPERPLGEALTDETVRSLLEQDPRLEYQVESDQVYVVSGGNELSLIVPKERNAPDGYLPEDADAHRVVFRLLGWAFLGLAPAGLGTLILAPLAAVKALKLYHSRPPGQADRTRAAVALAIAGGMTVIALGLSLVYLGQIVS
jgi:hypothetical protein